MLPAKFQSAAPWLIAVVVLLAVSTGVYQVFAQPFDDRDKATTRASAPARTSGTAATASQPADHAASTAPASAPSNAVRIHVLITGKVQGVGFRAFTQDQAQKLKLTGFVRNLKDGRVEVVAQGSAADIAALVAKIRQGPQGARVDNFDSTDETPAAESQEFQVK